LILKFTKLASGKAFVLSYAGRVELIVSMLLYSINIYSWPVSLIRELETLIRNFIWSGDAHSFLAITLPCFKWLIEVGTLYVRL
jgi:hypothetical protein